MQICPRLLVAAAFLVALARGPASAQQSTSFSDLLPPPADTGKARLFIPPPASAQEKLLPCPDGFSCRLRLLGELRKNGAIELRATTLTW